MGKSERRKGVEGTHEAVQLLRAAGLDVQPTLNNSPDLPDATVIGSQGIVAAEFKNHIRPRLSEWIAQAEGNAARANQRPLLAWRRPGHRHRAPKWYAILPLEDLARLLA